MPRYQQGGRERKAPSEASALQGLQRSATDLLAVSIEGSTTTTEVLGATGSWPLPRNGAPTGPRGAQPTQPTT
jgi:hypothetical protein